MHLFGLPACLLLVFFTGRKLLTRSAAAPASTVLPTPARVVAAPADNSSLAILAASLRLPHGASPEELASAIAGNKALRDDIREWLALHGMAEPCSEHVVQTDGGSVRMARRSCRPVDE